jgi:hypothetical protein
MKFHANDRFYCFLILSKIKSDLIEIRTRNPADGSVARSFPAHTKQLQVNLKINS